MSALPPRRGSTLPAWLALTLVALGFCTMQVLALVVGAVVGIRVALLVSEMALVAPALLACLLLGRGGPRDLALEPVSPSVTFLSLLAGAFFWVGSLGLLDVQYAAWQPPPGYLEAYQRLHAILWSKQAAEWMLSLAAIALVPAVFEELLFRGILLPSLAGPLGAPAAVLLSAMAFGAIHVDTGYALVGLTRLDLSLIVGSCYRVPFALMVGLGLGTIRVRSGSLWPSTMAHALLNATTFIAEGFLKEPTQPEEPTPLLGAALLVAGCAGAILILRKIDSSRSDS